MTRIAILGATGYTALELIKILLRHPEAEIVAVTSRQEGQPPIAMIHPSLTGRLDLRLEDLSPAEVAARAECVFSCLPHGASASVIPHLLDAGARVVDFSADYRLNDPEVYAQWYGQKHADPGRLGKVVYGLPELFREQIASVAIGGQSGLLSDVGDSGLGAAVEGGLDRSEDDHRRFEERRFRGGPHAEADHPLSRVQREHFGLQRRPASPHARDRADSGHGRRHDGGGDFHAAPGADGSRHPHDHLQPADHGSERREGDADDPRFLRRRAVCPRGRSFSRHEGLDGHELLRHHGPGRPRPRADDQLPRQSDQRRIRGRRAEFQSDVRLSGDDGIVGFRVQERVRI